MTVILMATYGHPMLGLQQPYPESQVAIMFWAGSLECVSYASYRDAMDASRVRSFEQPVPFVSRVRW